jgi:hypothetical protein
LAASGAAVCRILFDEQEFKIELDGVLMIIEEEH